MDHSGVPNAEGCRLTDIKVGPPLGDANGPLGYLIDDGELRPHQRELINDLLENSRVAWSTKKRHAIILQRNEFLPGKLRHLGVYKINTDTPTENENGKLEMCMPYTRTSYQVPNTRIPDDQSAGSSHHRLHQQGLHSVEGTYKFDETGNLKLKTWDADVEDILPTSERFRKKRKEIAENLQNFGDSASKSSVGEKTFLLSAKNTSRDDVGSFCPCSIHLFPPDSTYILDDGAFRLLYRIADTSLSTSTKFESPLTSLRQGDGGAKDASLSQIQDQMRNLEV